MKATLLPILSIFLATASLGHASEILINGGFETGDFTGWNAQAEAGGFGTVGVSAGTGGGAGTVGPASGTFYALTSQFGQAAFALTQAFTVGAGDTVTISFDLFANNYTGTVARNPLDFTAGTVQYARADLLTGGANLFSTSGADVLQNFYSGVDSGSNPNPYTHYSFDVSSAVAAGGTFQIRFGEANNVGNLNLGVDNVSVDDVPQTPEPGTLLLLFPAVGGLLALRKNFRG